MKTASTINKNKNRYTKEQWTSEMLHYEMLKNEYIQAQRQAEMHHANFEASFFEENKKIAKQEKLTIIALKIKILIFLASAFLLVAGLEMSEQLTVIYGAWSAGISLAVLAVINVLQWIKVRFVG